MGSGSALRWRFKGDIAGVGTTNGMRVVVGRWPVAPFGPFADIMVEHRDGHRTLLAPSQQIADFIGGTYSFDEMRLTPVDVTVTGDTWQVDAGPLTLSFEVGRRTALGWLLGTVPKRLAHSPVWSTLIDPVARVTLRGVRTRGTAGRGRREWYGATDVHRITSIIGTWGGDNLGRLRPVEPPVRFGFGSTPSRPSVTQVVTTVELAG